MMRGIRARDPHLHRRGSAYQRRSVSRCQRRLGVLELEAAVDGDRVVERGRARPAVALDAEQAVAEALVVVDEVEVVAARCAGARRPAR